MSIYDQIANAGNSWQFGTAAMKVREASEQRRMNEKNIELAEKQEKRLSGRAQTEMRLKQHEFAKQAVPDIARAGMIAKRKYLEENPGDMEGANRVELEAAVAADMEYDQKAIEIFGEDNAPVSELTPDLYARLKETALSMMGDDPKDEMLRLMEARDRLPEDHPDRKTIDNRISKISTNAPHKNTPSTVITPILAKLANNEQLTDGEQKALDVYQRVGALDILMRDRIASMGPEPDVEDDDSPELTPQQQHALTIIEARGNEALIKAGGYSSWQEMVEEYESMYGDNISGYASFGSVERSSE